MKKRTLFSLIIACVMLCGTWMSAQAQTGIPFDEYRNVLLSNYETYNDNQEVIVVLNVASQTTGVGWGLGHIVPINAHEETGKEKYEFICKAVSAEGEDNIYTFTIGDLKNYAKLNGEDYYTDQYGQQGISFSIYNGATLVSITVSDKTIEPIVPSLVIDFEEDAIGFNYPIVAYNPSGLIATVVENPTDATNKSLKSEVNDWDSAPRFSVLLPEGKTLNDIEKLTFNVYIPAGGDIDYKNLNCWFDAKGTAFSAGSPTYTTTGDNFIGQETRNTWLSKEFSLETLGLGTEVLGLNEFDMAFGIDCKANNIYYLDNITFIPKAVVPTGLNEQNSANFYYSNDVLYIQNASAESLSIYDLNGRTLKSAQNVSEMDISALSAGIYIVKAEIDGKPLVEKLIKR